MDTLTIANVMQIVVAVPLLWLSIVYLFYVISVKGGANPRVAVRWLYAVFFVACAAYLALLSPYRIELSINNPYLWVMVGVLVLAFAVLGFSYGRTRRGAA